MAYKGTQSVTICNRQAAEAERRAAEEKALQQQAEDDALKKELIDGIKRCMCMEMCIDMCMDICIDMCIGMGAN